MDSPRLITVYGATGNQGGAVAISLLKNSSFLVRALTRDPTSSAARALGEKGAEVCFANGFDNDSMIKAFQGSWGVFVNINSDDKVFRSEGPSEIDVGKNLVDAAIQAGAQHFVFSTGPSSMQLTNGKINSKAMESKHAIEQYARGKPELKSVNFIGAAWYLENFLIKEIAPIFGGFPFIPGNEDVYTFRCPRWGGAEDVPFVSIKEDYGDIVHGLFLDPAKWNGTVVHGCSDILSFDELASHFSKVTGKPARYEPTEPDWEAFNTLANPELEDTKLMFGMTQCSGGLYFGPRASEKKTATILKQATAVAIDLPEESHSLCSVEEWFEKHFS